MSTPIEQERQFAILSKKYKNLGQYIVSRQSGYESMNFEQPSYNSGTQAEANATGTGAPTDTQQVDADDSGDSDWQGDVPGATDVGDGDVTGALDVLQKHIESLGSSDLLNIWASTSDALKRTMSGDMIKKAVPNVNGSTREPLRVGDNTAASNAGPQGYIDASQLERKACEILKLSGLSSKICNIDRL
jgi:hypothetical protein